MGLGRGYLTRTDVSLDSWDIDVLISEANERLDQIAESSQGLYLSAISGDLSKRAAEHGQNMNEQVWKLWWDLLLSLHEGQRRIDEEIANR